jgi:hypothetical protein
MFKKYQQECVCHCATESKEALHKIQLDKEKKQQSG